MAFLLLEGLTLSLPQRELQTSQDQPIPGQFDKIDSSSETNYDCESNKQKGLMVRRGEPRLH